MTTCQRCHGFLRRDEDGLLWCLGCGRVENAPPVDPKLYKGLRPGEKPYGRKKANPARGTVQAKHRDHLGRFVVDRKATGRTHVA